MSKHILDIHIDTIYDLASELAADILSRMPIRTQSIPISSPFYHSIYDINTVQPYLIQPHQPYTHTKLHDDDFMRLRCFIDNRIRFYVCHLVGRIRFRRQGCTYEYLYYDIRHSVVNNNLIKCLNTSCTRLRLHRPCYHCDGSVVLQMTSVFIDDYEYSQEYVASKDWFRLWINTVIYSAPNNVVHMTCREYEHVAIRGDPDINDIL